MQFSKHAAGVQSLRTSLPSCSSSRAQVRFMCNSVLARGLSAAWLEQGHHVACLHNLKDTWSSYLPPDTLLRMHLACNANVSIVFGRNFTTFSSHEWICCCSWTARLCMLLYNWTKLHEASARADSKKGIFSYSRLSLLHYLDGRSH